MVTRVLGTKYRPKRVTFMKEDIYEGMYAYESEKLSCRENSANPPSGKHVWEKMFTRLRMRPMHWQVQ